jgi:hypothetical protein
MDPKTEYQKLYERMATLCNEQEWGDPFSYARSKEIYAAIVHGHDVAPDYSGADAYSPDGSPLEYKSTIGKNCKGSYTGISVQGTWEEQADYLKYEKIGKYPEHYYNRFDGGKLVESWKMAGSKVLELLMPKLAKKYSTVLSKKDPRLSADITWEELQKYGKRVL